MESGGGNGGGLGTKIVGPRAKKKEKGKRKPSSLLTHERKKRTEQKALAFSFSLAHAF